MTLTEFGSVSGPPLFGWVVDSTGRYGTAWLLVSCLCLAGALVALLSARGEKQLR